MVLCHLELCCRGAVVYALMGGIGSVMRVLAGSFVGALCLGSVVRL